MVATWILVFYLGAPLPWNKPTVSIDQIGEFATLEACTTAGKQIRDRLGDHGENVGFDCIDSTTGRTSSRDMFEHKQRLEEMENLLDLFGEKSAPTP